MRSTTIGFLLAALCALHVSGCGEDRAPTGGQTPPASSSPGAIGPGDPAQAAVTALLAGLRQGHPESFWEFLPADFQDDLNGLIHQFAERMDAELWDKAVSVLRKLAHVLKSQKQFLEAGAPAEPSATGQPSGAGTPAAAADWAGLAGLIDSLLDSDAARLERLKKADGGKLLATAGGKVIDQMRALSRMTPDDDFAFFFERLADLRVSIVQATKDRARLKFEAPGDTPAIVNFVLHKGKWIPEDFENEWQHGVGNARAWLSTTLNPESIAERKPEFLTILTAAEAGLDKMDAAATPQEFSVAGQEASRALLELWMALSGAGSLAEPAVRESQPVDAKELVTIFVSGELDEDAQNALRDRIKSAADDPDRAAAEITGDDETSTFRVGPVGDIAAFAARLDFLEITAVDEKTRTIQAKPRK